MVNSYIEELDEIIEEIKEKNGVDCDELIEEARGTLKQLKIAQHSVTDPELKATISAKIKDRENQLNNSKKATLFAMPNGQEHGELTRDEKNQASLATLEQARNQLAQAESDGENILGNLSTQNETMANTKKNLKEINKDLKYSDKLLSKMSKWWRG